MVGTIRSLEFQAATMTVKEGGWGDCIIGLRAEG
jgi:hypothetical protein